MSTKIHNAHMSSGLELPNNTKPHKIVTQEGTNGRVRITKPADPEKVERYHASPEYKRWFRARERFNERLNKGKKNVVK